MSRLTSRAPFNRTSAFDVLPSRPAPLSPPETEMESAPAMHHDQRQEDANAVSPEATASPAPMTTESPAAHFRRVSNLAYTSSSLSRREPRPTQKQSRWLVMVMPPASLTREPPTLGHTLSSAPAGRLSNGILMPLFPTLYGQLTAIAREFNMPSTTGLCIYLQLSESGASMLTPRISDESWQLLWGHFFIGDERAAPLPPHGLPISGHIEFDIDLMRARWFDAWMGHPRRDLGESEIMSREPSVVPTHWRGDSRTSLFPTEIGADESSPPANNPPVTAMSSRTVIQRQAPRPLLLERRDVSSVRSFSRHTSRAPSISHQPPSPDPPTQTALVEPAEVTLIPKALSPVAQEQEEPPTARKIDLQTKVHEWRQSSSVTGAATTALTAAGQPSLDPINMPSGADVELDLNDFQWSISSAGPPSESPVSADWPEPLPSVHLLERMQGSVCLTPSVATSFGPLDDDWPDSPVSCVSRRPSPDLGMRMLDYVPLTPTTATSWGPDDSSSAIYSEFEYDYRAPSVDIGVRGMGSRPVTPSTATSWGPPDSPLSFPPSPQFVRTPDAGERAFPDLEVRAGVVRAPVFPYYSAWETEPWGHVWPYQAHLRRESVPISFSAPGRRARSKTPLPEYPDFAALYPSNPTAERAAANKSLSVDLPRQIGYPVLNIYPTAYPYNLYEIYPTFSKAQYENVGGPQHREIKQGSPRPEWPDFTSLYPSDPRAERAAENKSQPVTLRRLVGYPFLEIYPTAYPYNLEQIYPVNHPTASHAIQDSQSFIRPSGVIRGMLPEWPDFTSLYPTDPNMERAAANKSLPVTLRRAVGYPHIILYETVYPHNLEEIYPPVQSVSLARALTTPTEFKRPASYQLFPEYPDFAALYPSGPRTERAAENKSQSVALPSPAYPFLSIYPPVYPWNLAEIYGQGLSIGSHITPSKEVAGSRVRKARSSVDDGTSNKSQPIGLPAPGYPFLSVYPPVYPWNLAEIYAPRQLADAHPDGAFGTNGGIQVQLPVHSGYPTFNLYPARSGYPTFEIYPPVLPTPSVEAIPSWKLTPAYPVIELYEPVYPHLVIYPHTQLHVIEEPLPSSPHSPRKRTPTPGPGGRRSHGLRSPNRPGNELDQIRRMSRSPVQKDIAIPPLPTAAIKDVPMHRKARKTHLDLHRRVFGDDSNPGFSEEREIPRPASRRRKTHDELHRTVFGDLSAEDSQGLDDFFVELPRRSAAPSPVPVRQRSRSGSMSSREPTDLLDKGSQRSVDIITEMSRTSSPTLVRQRSPSGTVSSRVVAEPSLSHEDSQRLYDAVAELRPTVPASSPTPTRQRSRSGTVSSRGSQPPAPPPNFPPPAPPITSTGRARRPSVSTSVHTESSPSPGSVRSSPSPNTSSPLASRTRSPSVSGSLPPAKKSSVLIAPPVRESSVLSRVRSMNTPMRPVGTAPRGTNISGLDRSKSLSDVRGDGTKRQSIVLERAKMFAVSGQ